MTDFSKPQDGQDGQDPNEPPRGSVPPPQGGFPPPPQGNYGQPGGVPAPGQFGAYPPAPPPAYGAAPAGYYFDPRSGLTLPNGTELASHGRRIGAYFLAIPLLLVTLIVGYLIWGLLSWGKGTSPALRVLKMKCYKPSDGTVAGFGTMALRDIVGGIVQGIVGLVTALVSFVLFLATSKRQTLPDLIGSTVVLHDPNGVLER